MNAFDNSVSVPFTITGVYQGLASVSGLLHVSEAGLHLEFRVSDTVLGVLKSKVRDITLELSDLESVEFRNGWFRKRICIHTRGLRVLADVPGGGEGYIELRIHRKHRERVRSCVSRITLGIAEERLRAIERRADRESDRLYG